MDRDLEGSARAATDRAQTDMDDNYVNSNFGIGSTDITPVPPSNNSSTSFTATPATNEPHVRLTPITRKISKAKMGVPVHTCCNKTFYRKDLLDRHIQRHEQGTHSGISPSSSSQSISHSVEEYRNHLDNGFEDYSSSSAFRSCISSSNVPAPVSDGGTEKRAANETFMDLLYSTVDLRKLIQPVLKDGYIDLKRLTAKLRKLLKLFGQDLSAELQYPESTRIGGFFKKSSKLLSREIINGLSQEERDDVTKRTATSAETDLVSEGDELDDSSSEDEPAAPPDMLSIQSLVASTNSFNAFITRLVNLVDPSFESRLKHLATSQSKDLNDSESKGVAETVSELLYSKPLQIYLEESERTSWLDKSTSASKPALSNDWDWWPFTEPQLQSPPNFATLSWICLCGDIRRQMVPKAFARRVVKIRAQTLPVSSASADASPNFSKGHTERSPSQTTTHGVYKYQQSSIKHSTPGQSSIISSGLPATISMPSTSRYIMFFVDSGGLKLSAIESESLCNEQLFRQMRSEFRRIKGWFKTWFGLMKFSHCDFYQFEQWHPESLGHSTSLHYPGTSFTIAFMKGFALKLAW
ncbi:hypothetical protein FANTH_11973 [Fusarium anthophilum]|uniref:C2H2-type domain-containing protein n=1 Tax=Fusarium anthophilum TaxID=48485 RepID=A0A8H5DT21_9HYPO|nr:hypothetical protein FANTH_11973 [Fusarium anthophilum]